MFGRLSRLVVLSLWAVLLPLAGAVGAGATANDVDQAPHVDLLSVTGTIDPVNAQYVERGLDQASRDGAALVLIELDTPGGLDSAMRQITGAMLKSPVPIAVYVTPAGARAGSAGVFITMAADVAAMAPATNIGAAHPVDLGGGDTSNLPDDERTKVTNDAAAYMRVLATTRHHNAEWAESAVRESVALTADEAKAQNVVDLIEPDRAALLAALDGWSVKRPTGTNRLATTGATIQAIDMTFPEQLLHLVDDPNIAYLLLSIGFWALLAELFHPGSILPGVTGLVSLALGLTALQSLPMSWTGLALIVVSLGLFVVDIKAPTHGGLTLAGAITFVVGSLMLYSPSPGAIPNPFSNDLEPSVNPLLIALIAVGLVLFFAFIVRASLRVRRSRPMTLGPIYAGAPGVAVSELSPSGLVKIAGEEWRADAENGPIHPGDHVRVISRKGLKLTVKRETSQ
jgi:membrane-bound serine protease (ClpP class)